MRRLIWLLALLSAASADDAGDAAKKKEEARVARRVELRNGFNSLENLAAEKFEDFALEHIRDWDAGLARVLAEPPEVLRNPVRYYLIDRDWEVVAFACIVAGRAGLHDLAPEVAEAYDDAQYPIVRRMAVNAAAHWGAPGRALLEKGLADAEPGVRLLAVEGLERIGDEKALEALARAMEDPDHDTRYRALGALARAGHDGARALLFNGFQSYVATKDLQRRPSLVDRDVGERYSQFLNALALGHWGEPDALRPLGEALQLKGDFGNKHFLAVGSAAALGQARPATDEARALRNSLLMSALTHNDAVVRALAAFAVGYTGDPAFLGPLGRLLKDAQTDVRHNAVEALGAIHGPQAVSMLEGVLRGERDVPVRLAALRALSRQPGEAPVDALAHALRDKRYVVRATAARLLGRRGPEAARATKDVLRAARDPDYGVREAAVVALARIGTPDGLPGIVGALRDPDMQVRIRALRALARFPRRELVRSDETAAEYCVRLLVGADDVAQRIAAREALIAVRPPHSVPLLLKELDAGDYARRFAAFTVLDDFNGPGNLDYSPQLSGTERREAVKRWEAWWETVGAITPPTPEPRRRQNQDIAGFHQYTRDLRWRGIDLVLAYDSTGSMLPVIRAVRQRLDLLIEESARIVPNLRMSLFTYRDLGEEYVYYGTPLTYATDNLKAFIQVAEANRGGDLPEAVTETVQAAIERLDWRPAAHKVIVVIGDAPYHPENESKLFGIVEKFAKAENRGTVHAIFTDPARLAESITARRLRADGGVTEPFLEKLAEMARHGGGRAVTIEDTERLIHEILVLSFGEQWRAELESRLDFD